MKIGTPVEAPTLALVNPGCPRTLILQTLYNKLKYIPIFVMALVAISGPLLYMLGLQEYVSITNSVLITLLLLSLTLRVVLKPGTK